MAPRLTLALTKASIDAAEWSAIVAYSAGTRIEIFGVLASRLGLIGVAIDHLDGPDNENLAAIAGLSIAVAERDFRLIDFDHALQGFTIRVDHRSAQFLGQQAKRSCK